jgi:capsular polysaccharide biosynthesis protein
MEAFISSDFSYSYTPAKNRIVKNCFVTYDGIVLKNLLLVKRCAFNLKGNLDNTFYKIFWREAVEKYLVCRFGKSIPFQKLNSEKNYVLIHSKWFNYSFWNTSSLPRLLQIIEQFPDKNFKLLVPEDWKEIEYVWESLKPFKLNFEIIKKDHNLFIDKLVFPETRKWTFAFEPKYILETKRQMTKFAYENTDPNFETFPKIYLSRGKRGVRCVDNEDEVSVYLIKKGFKILNFEDFTIWQQIVLMDKASHLISIHGAGLSNLMYMNKGGHVLELINREYAKVEYTFPFWTLANVNELNYYMQFCSIHNKEALLNMQSTNLKDVKPNLYLVNQNIIVEIELLQKNVFLMGCD